jgi:hypothetical protein
VVLPPKVEADSVAWYLRSYLGLPVTVGVVVDSMQKMPQVDGRQLYVDPTFYGRQFNSSVVVLYGPGGKLVYVARNLNAPVLRKLVARELQAKTRGQGQTGISSSPGGTR